RSHRRVGESAPPAPERSRRSRGADHVQPRTGLARAGPALRRPDGRAVPRRRRGATARCATPLAFASLTDNWTFVRPDFAAITRSLVRLTESVGLSIVRAPGRRPT